MSDAALTIFAITLPGLEHTLADEARALGLDVAGVEPGGVTLAGGWTEVWRANLELRCATPATSRPSARASSARVCSSPGRVMA
ncbi:MAG: THUMP domain-containing protein, partial [Pseudomonadota bacterium]